MITTYDPELTSSPKYIKVKNCYCQDEQKTRLTSCVICNVNVDRVMSQYEREWFCCQKITTICELPEFVCDKCTQEGWYSTAGWGEGTQHCNKITNQIIYK